MNKESGLPASICVTGATGFLGQSLGKYFASRGVSVSGLSRGESRNALYSLSETDYGPESLSELLCRLKPDVLVHAAGSSSVRDSIEFPARDFNDSALLFQRLLEGVRLSKIPVTVVLLSSAAAYGNPAVLPVPEEAPLAPISPYGFHKVLCETLGREYAGCYGIPVIAARLFSLYGPLQKKLLLWEVFEQYRAHGKVVLQGTGREMRDYLYVDDLAEYLLALLQRQWEGFNAINVASGESLTTLDVALAVGRSLGIDGKVDCMGSSVPGNPDRWAADISLLRRLVGEKRTISFESGVAECVKRWME